MWAGGDHDTIPDIVGTIFGEHGTGDWNGDLNDYPYFRKALTVFPCVDLPEEEPPYAHQLFERVFQLSQALCIAKDAKESLVNQGLRFGRVWEHPRKEAMVAAEENLCKALADLRSEYRALLDERLEGIPTEHLLAWTSDMVDEIVEEPQWEYTMRDPLDRPPRGFKGST